MWNEKDSIEKFIRKCTENDLDFRFEDPADYGLEKKYWAKVLKRVGPKYPHREVEPKKITKGEDSPKDNPYLFWLLETVPYYNQLRARYVLQPFQNNTIAIKLPKRPTTPEGMTKEQEGWWLSQAIAAYSQISPWMFIMSETPGLTNKVSGASSVGDLTYSEDYFGLQTKLFIRGVEQFSVYFMKSYQEYYLKKTGKPLVYKKDVEVYESLLAPNPPDPSYDLSNASSIYLSFGAAMLNLVSLIWNSEEMWKMVITKEEDIHKYEPGQTVLLINELLGYEYPFHFDFVILEDKEADFVSRKVAYSHNKKKKIEDNPVWKPNEDLIDWLWTWKYDGDEYKGWSPTGYKEVKVEEEYLNSTESFIQAVHNIADYEVQMEPEFHRDVYYPSPRFPLQQLWQVCPYPPTSSEAAPIALNRYNIDDSKYPFTC